MHQMRDKHAKAMKPACRGSTSQANHPMAAKHDSNMTINGTGQPIWHVSAKCLDVCETLFAAQASHL